LIRTLTAYDAATREATPGQDATWFDIFTATAFSVFNDTRLEWAIVEVGLGGRLDSTNVIDAEVAVVTNVELEHTEVLGSCREQIATEKVGILKSGAVLVTSLSANDAAGKVLQERANQLGCDVLVASGSLGRTIDEQNLELAALVLDHLGRCGEHLVCDGTEVRFGGWLLDYETQNKARLPGRLERLDVRYSSNPERDTVTVPVIFDGAHVPFNIAAVMRDLTRRSDLSQRCICVVALAADKDALGFMKELVGLVSKLIVTDLPDLGRNRPAVALGTLAASLGIQSEVETNSQQAFYRGLEQAAENGTWLLVTGSLSLIGVLRPLAYVSERRYHGYATDEDDKTH
jgi:dihydrofolate synthase / folylpolyglutamate synthase